MHSLRDTIARWMRMGRPRRWLIVLGSVVVLAVVAVVPIAAGPDDWPNCTFATCSAADLNAAEVWLGDADQNPWAGCATGEAQEAHIWVTVTNNTGTDRSAVGLTANVVIGGVSQPFSGCDATPLAPGARVTFDMGTVEWTCGQSVRLENVLVAWTNTGDASPCTAGCNKWPAGQCGRLEPVDLVTCDVTASIEGVGDLTCDVDTVTLTAGVTGGTDPFTYAWYKGSIGGTPISTGNSIAVTADGTYTPGTYYVVVTDDKGCSDESEAATVNDYGGLDVSISGAADFTCTVDTVTLMASASGGKPGYSYAWYDESDTEVGTGSTYSPTGEGTFYVVVTDANQCTATSDEVTINDYRDLGVSVSGADDLTCHASSVTLTASASGGLPDYSYQWYDDGGAIGGATGSTYAATAAGSYYVVVTDANDCTATSGTATVNDYRDLGVTVSGAADLTCDVDTVTLTANASGGESPYSYQWYDGGGAITDATEQTYDATAEGDYYVVVTDANQCTATSGMATVNDYRGLGVSISGAGDFTCSVDTVRLTASASGGKPGYSYVWYDDTDSEVGTGSTYSPAGEGTFYVVVTDANGCTATSGTATVNDYRGLGVSILGAADFTCTGEPVTLTANASGGKPDYTYQWYDADGEITDETGSTYSPTGEGTFYVVVTDANQCMATSDEVTVNDYRDVSVSIWGAADLTCEVTEVELTAEVTAEGEYSLAWHKGAPDGSVVGTESSITVSAAGPNTPDTYYVVVTSGTCSAWASATVEDTCVPVYELAITKTADVATAELGDVIHYTITIKNTSNFDLTGVTLDDAKLGVHEDIGDLAGGASWSGIYAYTVKAADVTAGEVVNVAIADSEETEEMPARCVVGVNKPPRPPCVRADVSVKIYGGWNGIPVRAWVGGTEQPTQYTALDSSGVAAVHWIFWPGEGETLSVRVEPELPAGLDPERWYYDHESTSVTIRRCMEAEVSFQLIDKGGPEEPTPAIILPVTGGEAEPVALAWWQTLVQWFMGLLSLLHLR